MNAVTAIHLPAPEYSDTERAHRAAITIHCPNENEAKMACRVAIAMMRDRASMGMNQCSDAAYPILLAVARQATAAVYKQASAKELFLTRCGLRTAMEAARMLERASGNREHGGG